MELRKLRYFLAVYDTKSFTAAGHQVGVTQSAVSQAVLDLETELKVKLLVREAGKVELSDEGKVLLGYARVIVQQHDRAKNEIFRKQGGPSTLTVGIHSGFPRGFFADVFRKFQARYPDVRLEIHCAAFSSDQAFTNLKQNIWDLAIDRFLEDVDDDLYSDLSIKMSVEDIMITKSHVYARQGHPLLTSQHLGRNELVSFPWIVSSEGTARELERLTFDPEASSTISIAVIADTFRMLLTTVSETDLLCMAPCELVAEHGLPLVRLEQAIIPVFSTRWVQMSNPKVEASRPVRFLKDTISAAFTRS